MKEERLKVVFKLAVNFEETTNTDVRMMFMSLDYRNAEMRQTYMDQIASCALPLAAQARPDRITAFRGSKKNCQIIQLDASGYDAIACHE